MAPVLSSSLQILLLHPDEGRRDDLARQLRVVLPGSNVEGAGDSRAAVRSLSSRRADLIVAGTDDGGLEGQALAQILRRNPVLSRKPLLLLGTAAWADQDPYARTLAGGLGSGGLKDALDSLLGERAATRGQELLVLSSGNAIRGPLAEALLRQHLGPAFIVRSCGHKGLGVHPLAVQAGREMGLDLGAHISRSLRELDVMGVEMTINLCFGEPGPMVPGRLKRLDWPTLDPLKGPSDDAALLGRIRAVRDNLSKRAEKLALELKSGVSS